MTGPMLIDVSRMFPAIGSYHCRDGCGAKLERPGVCDPCAHKFAISEHDGQLRAALSSIPTQYAWAYPDAPELPSRVSVLAKMDATRIAERIESLADNRFVLIFGPSGAGKTSLACAALRYVIDRGRFGATEQDFRIAKRARFFPARQIATVQRRDEYNIDAPEVAPRALVARSTFAVIDDVGQEAGDGYRANDRSQVLADIIADRYDSEARTIITTFATPAQWSAMYGDGIARRCWDKERVKVVRL